MAEKPTPRRLLCGLAYGLLGTVFGFTLVRSEVVSWYRIQEMFRFQAFHMYGVIASAIAVAAVSLLVIRRAGVRASTGEEISFTPKAARYIAAIAGGVLFGLGWALTGACPGPIFALIGAGYPVFLVVLLAAVAGTRVYGALRNRLPH